MTDQIGERIASLEAEFRSFRQEMLKDNQYIKSKLDKIEEGLSNKVDREYCLNRHDRLDKQVEEAEKSIRALERQAPAVVKEIVLVLSTGIVMAMVSYLIGQLP